VRTCGENTGEATSGHFVVLLEKNSAAGRTPVFRNLLVKLAYWTPAKKENVDVVRPPDASPTCVSDRTKNVDICHPQDKYGPKCGGPEKLCQAGKINIKHIQTL
jgi:hypothetical protein